MLNTNLHNPSVKEKQTVEHFVKMCREASKSEVKEQILKVNNKFCVFSLKLQLKIYIYVSRTVIIVLKKNRLKFR